MPSAATAADPCSLYRKSDGFSSPDTFLLTEVALSFPALFRVGKESANPLAFFLAFAYFLHPAAGQSRVSLWRDSETWGNIWLVLAVKFPLREFCGENQALFLWAVLLKQEPFEVIQESCLGPERGRNLQPSGRGGCQRAFSFQVGTEDFHSVRASGRTPVFHSSLFRLALGTEAEPSSGMGSEKQPCPKFRPTRDISWSTLLADWKQP